MAVGVDWFERTPRSYLKKVETSVEIAIRSIRFHRVMIFSRLLSCFGNLLITWIDLLSDAFPSLPHLRLSAKFMLGLFKYISYVKSLTAKKKKDYQRCSILTLPPFFFWAHSWSHGRKPSLCSLKLVNQFTHHNPIRMQLPHRSKRLK